MQLDLPAVYQQARRVIDTSVPGAELEALLCVLNPDRLPPTELQAYRPARWAEPWLLSGLSSSAYPALGWSDRVIWYVPSNTRRAGLLSLALGIAAWRGDLEWGPPVPEGLLARIGDSLASTSRLFRCGLRWLWAEFDDEGRTSHSPPPASEAEDEGLPVGDELWAHVRRLWAAFRRVDPEWRLRYELIDDMGTFADPPTLATPGQPLTTVLLPGGGEFEVWREDCVPSDLGVPSVCPDAEILPPALLAEGTDFLTWLEERCRGVAVLSPRQSVHWMGVSLDRIPRCRCPLLRPDDAQFPGTESELYGMATRLCSAVRRRAGSPLGQAEWEGIEHLALNAAIHAADVGRTCTPGVLGPPAAGLSWHGPAALPVCESPGGSPPILARSQSWEGFWETTRGCAAQSVMAAVRPRLVAVVRGADPSPWLSTQLALPDNAPADLRAAFDKLCWAAGWANRVARLRSPEHHFESTRQNLIGRLGRGETEWLTFSEREGIWPAVLGEDSQDADGCDGPDFDQIDSTDPIIDIAAQQLTHLLWAWCETAEAFREVESEFAVVPGDGFAVALAAVTRVADPCLAALGLSLTPPADGNPGEAALPGVKAYRVEPSLSKERLVLEFRRLPLVPKELLCVARTQTLATARRRAETDRKTLLINDVIAQQKAVEARLPELINDLAAHRRGGRVRGRPKQVDAISGRMMEFVGKEPGTYLEYTVRMWADLLGCSPSTVTKTAAWQTIKSLRAAAQAHQAERAEPSGRPSRSRK